MSKAATSFVALLLLAVASGAEPGPDHYRILGVSATASADEIKAAYRALAVRFHPDKNPSATVKERFLRIQVAYDTLSDPNARQSYDGTHAWQLQRFRRPSSNDGPAPDGPLLQGRSFRGTVLASERPWLVQVFDSASAQSRSAVGKWEAAVQELRPHAQFGRVAWSTEQRLVRALARATSAFGFPISFDDLPVVFGRPPGCRELSCLVRHRGALEPAALLDFLGNLLALPAVPAVTRTTLPVFLSSAPAHKVVVLAVSGSNRPASIALRQAAAQHAQRVHVGRIAMGPAIPEIDYWRAELGVWATPALVFLRGPGVEPSVVAAAPGDKLDIAAAFDTYSRQVVPALRAGTAAALGCSWGDGVRHADLSQLCLVVMGPQGGALDEGRAAAAALQRLLSEAHAPPEYAPAAIAQRHGRLKLTWLDSGVQSGFCRAHTEPSEARTACGGGRLATLLPPHWRAALFGGGSAGSVRLVAYKPGAGRLSEFWDLPHKYCTYETPPQGPQDALRDPATLAEVATWLAACLRGEGQRVAPQPPPPLASEDAPWQLTQWAQRALHSAKPAWRAVRRGVLTPLLRSPRVQTLKPLAPVLGVVLGLVVAALLLAPRPAPLPAASAMSTFSEAATAAAAAAVTTSDATTVMDLLPSDADAILAAAAAEPGDGWLEGLAAEHNLAMLGAWDLNPGMAAATRAPGRCRRVGHGDEPAADCLLLLDLPPRPPDHGLGEDGWEVVGREQSASLDGAHTMLRWLGSLQASIGKSPAVRPCRCAVVRLSPARMASAGLRFPPGSATGVLLRASPAEPWEPLALVGDPIELRTTSQLLLEWLRWPQAAGKPSDVAPLDHISGGEQPLASDDELWPPAGGATRGSPEFGEASGESLSGGWEEPAVSSG